MLEVRNISLVAGDFTLADISFSVEESSCHVLIGPTGSGKTLMLEAIIGFRTPGKGEIRHRGRNITNAPVESRGLSYLPQDLALFPHLSVRENIYYSLRVRRIKDSLPGDLVRELISTLNIGHLLDRRIENLSGGESQRVALARAIATGNRYLLLDEPFSALHEGMKKEMWSLLKGLQKKHKLTLLIVTHNLEEAFILGDKISIMLDGKVVQTGRGEDIYRRPRSLEVARFLGIRNLFKVHTTGRDGSVHCTDLETDLALGPPLSGNPEGRAYVGIRAEDVKILREEGYVEGTNILYGRITDIFYKGKANLVLFTPRGSRKTIEIEVPSHYIQQQSMKKGSEAGIFLRPDLLFTLP
ncbi:MAG: ABC transporter ATP-binding protein [Deltaproteobacteria bacterium]|nr:ABC transporter ATP-binding protein [Deltaproteobacteria bacterium]